MKIELLSMCMLLSSLLFSQQRDIDTIKVEKLDEIVVTATKYPTDQKNIGKIVYQITSQTIAKSKGKSVVDLLNDVTGVEINGNYGVAGQNLGYYIRGGRNKQVVILIDGLPVSDPSSFNNDFDLRQLPIDQIEKIEIVKGATSTLYGTGATTGVINIILKKSTKEHIGGNFTTSIGSNASQEHLNADIQELSSSFGIHGAIKKVAYLIALNADYSGGLSAAESVDENTLFKEDPFIRYNALVKLNYKTSERFDIGIFGSYDTYTAEYDGYDFFSGSYIDANNELYSLQKRLGITSKFTYVKGTVSLSTFITDINRTVNGKEDQYSGEATGFDLFGTYKVSDKLTALAGLTSQIQDMYQKTAYASIEEGSAKQNFLDPYGSLMYTSDHFNMNISTRANIHSEYGTHMVYAVNPSYNWILSDKNRLQIMASYGTAYVTPTLQEIFNKLPTIGDLKPEEDVTFETGIALYLSDIVKFNSTFFYREETNKIGYDYTTYQTINDEGTFYARGYEADLQYLGIKDLQLQLNYSYIKREESLLLKIPKHKVNLHISYALDAKTSITMNGKFVDVTKDFGELQLPSYRIVDLFLNRSFLKNRCTIFASFTNIFNEDFQEIAGFSTRGRNYKFGVQVNF